MNLSRVSKKDFLLHLRFHKIDKCHASLSVVKTLNRTTLFCTFALAATLYVARPSFLKYMNQKTNQRVVQGVEARVYEPVVGRNYVGIFLLDNIRPQGKLCAFAEPESVEVCADLSPNQLAQAIIEKNRWEEVRMQLHFPQGTDISELLNVGVNKIQQNETLAWGEGSYDLSEIHDRVNQ